MDMGYVGVSLEGSSREEAQALFFARAKGGILGVLEYAGSRANMNFFRFCEFPNFFLKWLPIPTRYAHGIEIL